MKKNLFLIATILLGTPAFSQITLKSIKTDLENQVENANLKNRLLTNAGFNTFMQRKTFNCLTGISDLSLAKFYAAYTTDNDKLNLGFNIPFPYQTERIKYIINPIIEADVKSNFATLYKNDKWKNNIRGGLKITYLFPKKTINYFKNGYVNDLIVLRSNKLDELKAKIDKMDAARSTAITPFGLSRFVAPDHKTYSDKKLKKIRKENLAELGKAEVDFVDEEGAYTRFQTGWISLWGFAPLSKTEQYITPSTGQNFSKVKFNLWEVNVQANYLYESRKKGTFYFSGWVKYFQNNSANASLMTNVDYGQYSQLPSTTQVNLALLETNKGYIGNYSEFKTTNLNLQVVYFFPIFDMLLKPGLSFRYEKNWGDYGPSNLRFGLPITIQGKEKPINIELQYRLEDISNYKNSADHSVGKTVGLSLGFPVVLLYK